MSLVKIQKDIMNCVGDLGSNTMPIWLNLNQFILLFNLFLRVLLYFLVLFMDLTVLFQLIFIFIYNIFNKKFSILTK